MTTGKYLVRSAKYLVKLIILLALLFALMLYSNTAAMSPENFFRDFIHLPRTWLLLGVIVVWSALYPKVEFVRRHAEGSMRGDRKGIIDAFNAGGMTLAEEHGGRMVFRCESAFRRVWWMWEDTVTVTQGGGDELTMEGPRRFVGEAQGRLPGYIQADREKRQG